MNIAFITPEAFPIYKVGGLGDVAGSLPKFLLSKEIDIRLFLPHHPEIDITGHDWVVNDEFTLVYDSTKLKVEVRMGYLPGTFIPVYLFKETQFITKTSTTLDSYIDKYAVFSKAVAFWLQHHHYQWSCDIIHCQDWMTALVPSIIKHLYQTPIKSLLTIHNLSYQGETKTPVAKKLGFSPSDCQILDWDQSDGDLNILLEGIIHAQAITTVSPTYAQEIISSLYNEKVSQVLKRKKHQLIGILNGIDKESFNPATDSHLFRPYSKSDVIAGKKENKTQLFSSLGLPDANKNTLLSFIGRIDSKQKGIDDILKAMAQGKLDRDGCTFIFLGVGDTEYEQKLHQAAVDHHHIKIITRFDEPLARKLYAASDLILIPSTYEPCGLVQMIAMRYGTLPLARYTGGLADTIAHKENGFTYKKTDGFIEALDDAISLITSNPDKRTQMIANAMSSDFSWGQSAKRYARLYRQILMGEPIHN